MSDFASHLTQARNERTPRMALRPDHNFPEALDDIVVEDVTMFRAEAMSDTLWWMACDFRNGERISFHVHIDAKPKRISVSAGEMPTKWIDIDEETFPPLQG
jgi:hypothetical protein